MLDQAFEALKKFDFGTSLSDVQAIDDAVIDAHHNDAKRSNIEQRLIAMIGSNISRSAKDFVCRKLALIGSAASVAAIAPLLANEANAHLARHALERIPGREAELALASAAKSLTGKLKIGAINSLGMRGETTAVSPIASQLSHSDSAVVRAAAMALGAIGGIEAATALQAALKEPSADKKSLIDSLLCCAESLLNQKKASQASAIYSALIGDDQSRLIRLAATRGLLACADA